MAEKKKNNNKDRKVKVISINLSWLYLLLIGVILWMLFFGQGNSGANPQKVEWEEVQQMALDGDVQEIDFVRNDYEGKIKIRPRNMRTSSAGSCRRSLRTSSSWCRTTSTQKRCSGL